MARLHGEIGSLRASQKKRLEALGRRRIRDAAFLSSELARELAGVSGEFGVQLGLLIDRAGRVQWVVAGDATRLYLPDLGRARAGAGRLRGLRLVRTELRGFALDREDLADLQKLRLDAVAVLQVGRMGRAQGVEYAYLIADEQNGKTVPFQDEAVSVSALPSNLVALIVDSESVLSRMVSQKAQEVEGEAAVLIGVWPSARDARKKAERSMAELRELARTAGVHVADEVIQIRRQLDPKTVLGRGKIEEITLRALELGAELLIFDRELAPSQLRAVTNATEAKVLDRTQLILDIFARNALSRDGKLQVELAQLKYTLPRLIDRSTAMSRLTGGIGGRGPGETKLEIHRRRANDRIHRLESEIKKMSMQRALRRKRRRDHAIPVVSIVGYTNAGKSTLLNQMTNADVIAENKLFATLDTTTRRLRFPEEREIILTDTVGFIRDLPKDLVNAFKATLEEVGEADLVLHVLDASEEGSVEKHDAVVQILEELGFGEIPKLVILNKVDETPRGMVGALRKVTGGIPVSAVTGDGLTELMHTLERRVFATPTHGPGGASEEHSLELDTDASTDVDREAQI